MRRRIPFYRHDLGKAELDLLAEVLAGEILTSGEYVERFEAKFAACLAVGHTLAVSSCTGALHLALLGLDIGPGDEVITTPMTFIATATAILEAGATPVFVDVEPETGNLDATRVEAAITHRTKAIMPVHLYGLMCDMRALRAVADRHHLRIIEDAAHCIEGVRDGVRPGMLSDAACFSFYATKNMTCGEGGALVTNDDLLHQKLKLLRLHGMTKAAADRARDGYVHWDMTVLGWKYNMSNIEAGLLLPQFARLAPRLQQRQALARRYRERVSRIPGLRLPAEPAGTIHAHHVFTIWAEDFDRDALIDLFKREEIGVVVNYRAVHLMQYFAERYGFARGAFPNAERIGDQTISLPFYPGMPEADLERVCDVLEAAFGATRSRRSTAR